MATVTLASRLATILHYLNRGYTVNIKDLSAEFDISERQIQKDIELFSDMYEIESLGSQNYKMKKGYKLIGTENEDVEIPYFRMLLRFCQSLLHNPGLW